MHPTMERLKRTAQQRGLWNLWISRELAAGFQGLMPADPRGVDRFLLGKGLSNLVRRHPIGAVVQTLRTPDLSEPQPLHLAPTSVCMKPRAFSLGHGV